MKIGIVGDIHWSKYSSILRSRGNKYSKRLENCIDSINWAEELLGDRCDMVVYLGDFFDHESLKSEEITALSEIEWNKVPHYFLVGNHELGLNDLSFSSAHIFNLKDPQVIDHPTTWIYSDVEVCYLPYILNNTGKLDDYFDAKTEKRIIFSHNDIAGIQLGKFTSTEGFSIENIENNCDLFINGHLHNGSKVSDKIYNVGNLTGQNFSEDAEVYKHNIFILDTDTLSIEEIENPFSLKFYKFNSFETLLNYDFPINSIVTAKLFNEEINEAKEFVVNNENIIAHRFIVAPNLMNNISSIEHTSLAVNHLDKFQEFIVNELGTDKLVIAELEEVIK